MSNKGFTYTLKLDAEINDLLAKTAQVKKGLETAMAAGKAPGAEQAFSKIDQLLTRLQEKASQPITSVAMFNSIQKDANAVEVHLNKLTDVIEELGTLTDKEKMELIPSDLKNKIQQTEKALATFNKTQKDASQKSEELIAAEKELASAQNRLEQQQKKLNKNSALLTATKAEIDELTKKKLAIEKLLEVQRAYEASDGSKGKPYKELKKNQRAVEQVAPGVDVSNSAAIVAELERTDQALKNAEQSQAKYTKAQTEANRESQLYSQQVQTLQGNVNKLNADFEKGKTETVSVAYSNLRKEAERLGVDMKNIPIDYTKEGFQQLEAAINNLSVQGLNQVTTNLSTTSIQLNETATAATNMANKVESAGVSIEKLDARAKDTSAFASRLQQFVGITGAAQAARKAFRDAYKAISDLDKVMTEMAVVTDLEVGDYWEQMPEHTKRASELGIAITEAYEAEMLYYQQGLKNNQVIGMANETLKMARIANLSAKDATDKMTAALRGFNMELNETSVERVADVYSKLAAITASDVKEISNAMTKTASIAASAGMEFETTAAFLSQIVETTRESAETAGTALKTVIARFQELKKDPSEIGEVDGEIVDANKIETALRTVGVSLRDASGQFRELDDVFLELSSKWDSLDTNTQRYIATVAAGSRQQSRFIAMMADYGRTQELVTAANNSAGASQGQYEKTLESLESKINQLKNAWTAFTTGIMDDKALKFGIDALTKIMEIINQATNGISEFGSSLSKIGVAFAAFKIGKILVDKLLTSVRSAFTTIVADAVQAGKNSAQGFADGAKQQAQNAANSGPKAQEGGIVRRHVGNVRSGIADLGQAQDLGERAAQARLEVKKNKTEDLALRESGNANIAAGQSQINAGQSKIDAAVGQLKLGFDAEFSSISKNTQQAEQIWNKYVADIKKGGVDAKKALDSMEKELQDVADKELENAKLAGKDTKGMKSGKQVKLSKGVKDGDKVSLEEIDTQVYEDIADGQQMVVEGQNSVATGNEQVAQSFERENDAASLSQQANAKFDEGMKKISNTASSAGMAMMGLGMGVSALGSVLESAGVDGAAETFGTVASILTTLGTLFMALPPIVTIFGKVLQKTGIQGFLAGLKVQLGFWPLLLIFLAIVAVVATLIAIFVSLSKNTPEAKLKRAEEAAQKAGEAADDAAESYKNLKDSLDSLSNKYKALEDLTRGSQEWRDAVREINDEVMNLVDQYPELSNLVTSKDGVLTLDVDSKEVQEIVRGEEKRAIAAKNAEYAAQAKVLNARNKVDQSNLSSDAKLGGNRWDNVGKGAALGATAGAVGYGRAGSLLGPAGTLVGAGLGAVTGGISGAIGGLFATPQEDTAQYKTYTDAMAKALADGTIMQNEEGDWNVKDSAALEALGLTEDQARAFAEELGDASGELQEYGKTLRQREEEEKALYEAMGLNAVQMIDQNALTEKEMQQATVAADATLMKAQEEAAKKNNTNLTEAEAKKKAAAAYGVSEDEVEVDKDGNVTVGSGDDKKEYSKEEFEAQMAAVDATNAAAAALEQLPKTIRTVSSKMSEAAGKAFEAMYAGKDGSGMTKADIEEVQNNAYTKAEMEAIWGTLSLKEQEAYGSFDVMWTQYSDSIEAGIKALQQATEKSQKAGIEVVEGISMEAASGYADHMRNIYLQGAQGAKDLDDTMQKIAAGLSSEDKEAFYRAVNALDWSSVESIEGLSESLESLNVSIDAEVIENFEQKLIDVSGAIKDIDLEKIKDVVATLTNLAFNIDKGTQGRVVSESDYNAILELDPKMAEKFGLSREGEYIYLGESMDALREAILKATAGTASGESKRLAGQIAMADVMREMNGTLKQGNRELDFNELVSDSTSDDLKQKGLIRFVEAMKESKAEISGIEGLSNNITAKQILSMDTDELNAILSQLNETEAKRAENLDEYEKSLVDNASIIYQQNAASENVVGLSSANGGQGPKYEELEKDKSKLGDFNARNQAMTIQAASAGVSESLIEDYNNVLSAYKKGEATYSQVIEKQRELTKATDYANMRTNMQAWFEQVSEIGEVYSSLADGDAKGKINEANKALSAFGLTVDNEADADKYMTLVTQISQGNQSALNELVGYVEESGNLTQDFYAQMHDAGLGTWENTEEGLKFVWATGEEMASMAELAGTALEEWEHSYNWLYNYNEQINSLTREREKSERAYNKLLEDESYNAKDIIALSNQQLGNLREEAALRKQAAENALSQMQESFAENTEFSQYVGFDPTTGAIQVDWEGLDSANFTEEQRTAFEKFVSELEENRDVLEESQERLDEIEEETKEIENRGKDETSDLYDDLKDALIADRQSQIDELQTINDSIQEMQSALVDTMQRQIEEARQARENEKKESDIADKETRLAYLMQDTSGGSAMEIAALQKEIAQDKQGYTDTLVDQQLQSLQDANAAAAEQRQQQIDLQQAQLDLYANSAEIWTEVQNILYSSLLEQQSGKEWRETQAGAMLENSLGIKYLNPIAQKAAQDAEAQRAELASVHTGIGNLDDAQAEIAKETKEWQHADFSTIDGSIKSEAGKTTSAVNAAKGSINNIVTQAKTFGQISPQTIDEKLKLITGASGNEKTLKDLADASSASDKFLSQTFSETQFTLSDEQLKNMFAAPIPVVVKREESFSDSGPKSEEEKKKQAQHDAIQKAVTAVTSWSSGGVTGVKNSDQWSKLRAEYVKAGGNSRDFEYYVKQAMDSGSGYDFGTHYDSKNKEITSGTFPGTKVNGLGNGVGEYDTATFYLGGENVSSGVTLEVPRGGKNKLNQALADEIDSTYGKQASNGWAVLYKGEPYIYNGGAWRYLDGEDNSKNKMQKAMKAYLNPWKQYETGGLADFTGPAWLDGTKSKPEIVLNQTDSANFMQLRDILADILNGTSSIPKAAEGKGGDNYYEINIDVESISDDYDVEQLADKIKDMIYEDSIYRNVNSINTVR